MLAFALEHRGLLGQRRRAKACVCSQFTNYTEVPEWGAEVRRLIGVEGADLVLEVGGEKSFAQALQAVRMQGVFVGSRAMHESLVRFVEVSKMKSVVDRSFEAGRQISKVAQEFI